MTSYSLYTAISSGDMRNRMAVFRGRDVTILEGGMEHRGGTIREPWVWALPGCIQMIENVGRVEGRVLQGVVEVFGAGHLTQRNECCFLL